MTAIVQMFCQYLYNLPLGCCTAKRKAGLLTH
jgi:hypothetical protein